MAPTRLGRVQLRIMQVLWEKGRASAREITEVLNGEEQIAHSTVQTLLRKLERKGAVEHAIDGRTFVFRPRLHAENVTAGATRDLINRVFGGSPAGLVAFLLKHERLSRKELKQIRSLIDGKGMQS